MTRFLAAALVLISLPMPAAAEPFDDGVQELTSGNFGTARAIFEPLAANGNGNAQFMLGVMHENGLGAAKDLSRAAQYYAKAADAGVSSAQYNLAIFYQLGKGVKKSVSQALRWHTEAAAQGHHRAQNNLGTMYYTGAGVARDPVEAWKWLTLSSKGLKGEARDVVLKNLSAIERELTADALQNAKRRVEIWKPVK